MSHTLSNLGYIWHWIAWWAKKKSKNLGGKVRGGLETGKKKKKYGETRTLVKTITACPVSGKRGNAKIGGGERKNRDGLSSRKKVNGRENTLKSKFDKGRRKLERKETEST